MKRHLQLLEMQSHFMTDLSAFAHENAKILQQRMTIVDAKGRVVAESDTRYTINRSLEERPEIEAATTQEFASALRRNESSQYDTLFVAHQILHNGRLLTIRLGFELTETGSDFNAVWTKMSVVFIVVLILAYLLSQRLRRNIQRDINQIVAYLDQVSEKNYKAVIKIRYFYEFMSIALSLKNFAKKLSKIERQKRKHTARMRLINKQRNDILSAISHEFKNPIASVIGYAETLQEDLDAHLKIRERFLGKIVSNAKKISMMIDRLALSVKLENNDLKIKTTQFDLCELLQESANNMLKRYPDRTIAVLCEPCLVNADKVMLDLVVTNLMDNALKYSEEEVTVAIDDRYLSVIDKGIGIPAAELEQITNKFYRVEKNTWDNSMGLGLAIVGYILKLHGSQLDIKSEVMEGSIFRFQVATMKAGPFMEKESEVY